MTVAISFIDEVGTVFLVKRWSTVPSMGDTLNLGYPATKKYLVVRREWPLIMNDDFEKVDVHVQEVRTAKKRKP